MSPFPGPSMTRVAVLASTFIVAVIFVVALLFQLLSGPTQLKQGTVISKEDDPAHNETVLTQIYAGQSCTGSGISRFCTPRYSYIPEQVYVPERFVLHLRDCSTDKCKTGIAVVGQSVYATARVGQHWSADA